MSKAVLRIDIAKQKFEVALLIDSKLKHKVCKNNPEGFDALKVWLQKQKAPTLR